MAITHAIVYSNVWEDPELNRLSLHVKPTDSVLSITSGGCNSLNLLLEGPERVVSIDLNPAQLALLELKIAAIKELSHEDFLELLGAEFFGERRKYHPEHRLTLYDRVARHMSAEAREFFERNPQLITSGLVMCGRVERFFTLYRKAHSLLYAFDPVQKLFFCNSVEEQRRVYDAIPMGRWRFLNWVVLNRTILSLVKGAHSFRFVDEKEFDKNLNRKVDRAMRALDNRGNWFFQLVLLGKFLSRDSMPPYMLAKNFDALKANIGRIEVYRGVLTDVLRKYGPESFDKFNLSNITEWMEEEVFNGVMREVISLARPGARFNLRYTLARARALDAENSRVMIPEPELAARLHAQDRSFMYESFHVYRVEKEPAKRES